MNEPNLTPRSLRRTTASADAVMKGHGFYNEHSRPQQNADSLGLPLLERAVGEMTVPQGAEPAAVADFGAAQGRNSLEPMHLVVEKLRQRTTVSTPILVIHTDLPQNDFASLFTLGEDWQRFLGHRARELRPGGELVVVAVTTDEAGSTGGESLMDLTNEPLLAIVDAGFIRPQEYRRMNMPAYHRTMEEFTELLRSGTLTEDLILKEGIRAEFSD